MGAVLCCSHFLVREIPATPSWAAFPGLPHTWQGWAHCLGRDSPAPGQPLPAPARCHPRPQRALGQCHRAGPVTSHLATVSKMRWDKDKTRLKCQLSTARHSSPWLQNSCTRVRRATTWPCTAIFKLKHSRLQGKKLVTRLLPPPLSSCCPVRQSELISHLAPRLLFSGPQPAPSHLEQEWCVLISPQQCLKMSLLGLVLGPAADAEQEHLPPWLIPPLSLSQPGVLLSQAPPGSPWQPLLSHSCSSREASTM